MEKPDEESKIASLKKIDSLLNKDYLYGVERRYGIFKFSEYNRISGLAGDRPQTKISGESNVRALRIDRWVFDKEEQSIDKFKNILSVFAGGESSIALLARRNMEGVSLYFILKNETSGTVSKSETSDNNASLLTSAIVGNFNGTKVAVDGEFKFNPDSITSISCLTNIPSEKSEQFISQGLEKLLDGVKPEDESENYDVLILAEPLTHDQIQSVQNGYEELASAIAPYAGFQFSVGSNKTDTEGTMESLTNSENIFSAVTKTHSVSAGIEGGVGPVKATASYSFSHSKTEGKGTGTAETTGKNYNLAVGTNENTTYTYESFTIKGLLEKLQKQLERINNGQSLGLWKCASYVLAGSPQTAVNVANFLKSLTQGDESYIEPPIINTWSSENKEYFENILQYLVSFTHPIFGDGEGKEHITPTYSVSTTELSKIMAFPRKSVSGLPVLECAAFGREAVTLSGEKTPSDIELGFPYHMHKVEDRQPQVMLDKNSLTSHTFITGSTGSGKSNTVYQILDGIRKSGAAFLVVEPAKGEYKNVFGNDDGVQVYGTNPKICPLLRINPFSFPDSILIQEHLDRLVEIFNVCWPMYAAMPAVLKDAVESSYQEAGWDLGASECRFEPKQYPAFSDVVKNIRSIIESSEYSDENKGNYKGSLITRLKSLTNGINGMIFTSNEISAEDLFDKNVIVDLSRVGSMETKSLIMGLLVMKLQEHRMMTGKMNAGLRHVTVLEEAHNLLKRTSTEQSGESANLLGKSVEMLANAIAEMRTYGEGFIIADQSPGLLDMSVIRNTNTKIILRLPDESDRELVGKSAGLNDDQVVELARLQRGVAAVYQNNWVQPVLCMVKEYVYNKDAGFIGQEDKDYLKRYEARKLLMEITLNNLPAEKIGERIERIDPDIFEKLEAETVASLFRNHQSVFREAIKNLTDENDKLHKLKEYLMNHIEPALSGFSAKYQNHILRCIINENARRDGSLRELPEYWNAYIEKMR